MFVYQLWFMDQGFREFIAVFNCFKLFFSCVYQGIYGYMFESGNYEL